MKCLVRQYRFSGGAPRSLFEYLSIINDEGYDIINIATPKEQDLQYQYESKFGKSICRIDINTLWKNSKILSIYRELCWEYRFLKKEKPDLVIVLGEDHGFFYSYFCKKLGIPLITVIAGGDLEKSQWLIEGWQSGESICFSEENRDVIVKHFPSNQVNTISNRIHLKNQFNDFNQHYCEDINKEINILIVSRLSVGKMNSIYNFLDHLSQIYIDIPIRVRIAGDGDELNSMQELLDNKYSKSLNVSLLGHVDDMIPEFKWAHIVVGKGRSVIEPIMMNRIGVIIGEDGRLDICNKESLCNLYHYNFSGRNIDKNDSHAALNNIVDRLINKNLEDKELKEISLQVAALYSTEYLKEKLDFVIKKAKQENVEKSLCGPWIFGRYLTFLVRKMQNSYYRKKHIG
ncbi:hypothetical protein [Ruminococcus sp.]|uniref:hypothetical protein n=1 Tax=Ruminococcus sp. TaxID=41978 RepID=UPI001B7A53F8|nr:hypothetical protein [Ruminococcus sp.]MBP5432991.1 glycosyltransferase family 4 protein [Ruminococcus sp.]